MYELFFRLVLSRIPAETAHRSAFWLIRVVAGLPVVRTLLRWWLVPRDPALKVDVFGREMPGPLGLAAGFDKEARGVDALATLGFGHIEIGTVTARPQPGNPRPRMFRLTADRALVNRMGFNNAGAAVVGLRLERRDRKRSGRTVVTGVNIGKTKAVAEPEAVADYVASTRQLAHAADYLVVNVSSPNTPGLRNLQAVTALRPLLEAVRAALDESASRRVPLLVKIAPDLADDDVDAVADLAVELGLDGIIATNTTIARSGLTTAQPVVDDIGAGGLSGAPLKRRSLEVLRRLHDRVGDRLVLVAAGGIESADDAWERIRAGATLVQGYTGFVYGGPFWPRRLHRELAGHVRAHGFRSISEAVGTYDSSSGSSRS